LRTGKECRLDALITKFDFAGLEYWRRLVFNNRIYRCCKSRKPEQSCFVAIATKLTDPESLLFVDIPRPCRVYAKYYKLAQWLLISSVRYLAERQLKVLNMSERHSGASPLVDVLCADCSACPHRALLEAGKCVPGDICLTAQSGRQIDRFLRRNPQIAQDYLSDGFWERRAIAARYAPLELVRKLPRDVDEVVRRVVASRLPIDELDDYLHDSDREVRMTVAERIAPDRLTAFVGDEDYLVRLHAAKRLPHGQLRRMVDDEDREVRKEVARRLPSFALSMMAKDEDVEVRRIVAARVLPADATKMLTDSDWVVRLEAAQLAPLEDIAELVDDVEPDVRAAVRQRLNDFLLGENE